MRLAVFLPLGRLVWVVVKRLYTSVLIEIHGVWKPIPTDIEPGREVHRLNGQVRTNHELEQLDVYWNRLGEEDKAKVVEWGERRPGFARWTRG